MEKQQIRSDFGLGGCPLTVSPHQPSALCPVISSSHIQILWACGFHHWRCRASPPTTWLPFCISSCINPITWGRVIITAVHAYKTTRVTCHRKPRPPLLTPLFFAQATPQLIPGSDGGVETGCRGGEWQGHEGEGGGGVMEVNSPSLFTGCKGPRQSVSALVPGQ